MVSTQSTIDTSNFKFIQVKDQYFLAVAVRTATSGKYINFFSQEEDLVSYVDVSYSGFDLPAVEIVFGTSDESLIPYLTEKSVFVVSVGKDMNTQVQSTFNIVAKDIVQKTTGKWAIRIVGVYDKLDFVKKPVRKVWAKTSSEAAKEILQSSLGKAVKTKTDVRSKDKMFWIQSKQSNQEFLYDLWIHSYIPDSLWYTAITFEGQPIITDLRKQAKSTPKIMLTTGNSSGSNTYTILDNFTVKDNSMLNNNIGGYTKTRKSYNLDEARKTELVKKDSVILSDSNTFNRATGIETEGNYVLQNENMHEYYHTASLSNRGLFLGLKSFQLDVSVEGKFLPVELLDYVVVKDVQSNTQAQGDYSGSYMVGKIAHQIGNKKVYTHLSLWRESQNKIAAASVTDKAKETESKVEQLENKINTMQEEMTSAIYDQINDKYNALQEKLNKVQKSIDKSVTDSEAYKAYKSLQDKYRKLQSYMTDVYTITTLLNDFVPGMDAIQDSLNEITADMPQLEIASRVRKYLNIQQYMNTATNKITDKINSNSVYTKYTEATSKYNQMTSRINTLQNLGIIGDLSEYIESKGETE